MKKKILICIFAFLLVLLVSGCEEKKQEENLESGTANKTATTETKNNDNDDVIDANDDEIIDYDGDDNYEDPYACTKDKGVTFELINCQNCVFAFFNDDKTWGSVVSDYTKDYTALKDKYGCQRRRFLGFILDSGNRIQNAYTCGIKNNKVFCIEGSPSAYETNVKILQSVYSASECKYIANGKTYTCTDGDLNADTRADGQAIVHYDENCHIFPDTNRISCYKNW